MLFNNNLITSPSTLQIAPNFPIWGGSALFEKTWTSNFKIQLWIFIIDLWKSDFHNFQIFLFAPLPKYKQASAPARPALRSQRGAGLGSSPSSL
ncbi:hypothetical protein COT82_02110 [Candidatus Campbellbacteria bacterium CG10_big_fil_rev_8_21_14_0_10_35_52]|uniref:Uncharacterized protein n=1 Tax=Candidatus Campbellbacteria bacterium CG10_big_fil_rev_8_21_14_0_10_35_52 TaxID=1974527 RepID=A0A2M6WV05_9BACT|nr:MAG: hypothetical protein COT82_02110 [Candidatus Campbellbacteria bacterium CG10_big_fil_rev_8_21_14_0_10_35_52]